MTHSQNKRGPKPRPAGELKIEKRIHLRLQDWDDMVAAAEQHGISVGTYCVWLHRLQVERILELGVNKPAAAKDSLVDYVLPSEWLDSLEPEVKAQVLEVQKNFPIVHRGPQFLNLPNRPPIVYYEIPEWLLEIERLGLLSGPKQCL